MHKILRMRIHAFINYLETIWHQHCEDTWGGFQFFAQLGSRNQTENEPRYIARLQPGFHGTTAN